MTSLRPRNHERSGGIAAAPLFRLMRYHPRMAQTSLPVSLSDIRAASTRILPALVRTPTRLSRTLSNITGAEVHLKFENRQFTASFKERGALNKLLLLPPEAAARGVIAASAGNHAQGLAYHAGRLSI